MLLDHVMQELTAFRQVSKVAERGAHFVFVISISRHEIQRCVEWRQQFAQSRVLLRLAVLDRIAGEDHRIGFLLIDIGDAATQAISPQRGCRLIRCGRQDVSIADLGDEQWL